MMLDRKSIYTLNKKDPEAIVYTDADKHIIRLTCEDFDTEADFLKWKEWSDADYHIEEKHDHVQANHTTSFDDLSEKVGSSDGPELIIEQRFEKLEKERYAAETVIRVKGQLTEKQFRRIWMRYVDGLDVETIARREGKVHSSISESISAARKKIISLLSKDPTF